MDEDFNPEATFVALLIAISTESYEDAKYLADDLMLWEEEGGSEPLTTAKNLRTLLDTHEQEGSDALALIIGK